MSSYLRKFYMLANKTINIKTGIMSYIDDNSLII